MTRRRAQFLAVAAALLVTAASCRPEAPPDRPGAANRVTGDYFPMVPKARWLYSIRSGLGRFQVEVIARSELPLSEGGDLVFVMDERNLGRSLGFAVVAPVGYVKQGGYLARVTGVDYVGSDPKSGKLQLLGRYEPTWMFPEDPKPGQSWVQQTDMFGNAENPGALMGWSGRILELSSVEVPAGRFDEVLDVETEYRDASEGSLVPKVVYHDYYARGVGLIKSVTEDPSGDESNRIEQVLLEFSIP
jgi:hypothetical protein